MRARFINEMNISSVKVEDIVNKKFLDSLLMDSFLEETFKYQYADENNLSQEDIEDMDSDVEKDFMDWFKYEIENRISETINKFEYEIIKNNKISIWRVITVDKNWIEHLEKQGNRLGIYWAWDEDAAEAHWGHNLISKIPVLIESEINVEHIDWIETIKQNMNPEYEEEKEIRLFKNTPLKIKSLKMNGKNIDISNIQDKTFKA